MKTRLGLTLIELLIVMTLVLIISALALQNFGDALVSARIARTKSEFRTIAGAIEAYTLDHNNAPRMAHYGFFSDPLFDEVDGLPVNGILSRSLTTPVPYLSASNRLDPCMVTRPNAPLDEQFYTYQVHRSYIENFHESSFWKEAFEFYGPWRLGSVGPDLTFDHSFANSAQLPYDPTNGLISYGNIWYSPKQSFGTMPPIPKLLGTH